MSKGIPSIRGSWILVVQAHIASYLEGCDQHDLSFQSSPSKQNFMRPVSIEVSAIFAQDLLLSEFSGISALAII
jgi:hypothetical protein